MQGFGEEWDLMQLETTTLGSSFPKANNVNDRVAGAPKKSLNIFDINTI